MKRSEKILLAVFIAALLAWQGSGLVHRVLLAPIDEQQAKLNALNDAIAEKEDQQLRLMRVDKQLRNRMARSLPPEPLTAQRLYQSWLTDLAQNCGFGELKVFPDRITNKSEDVVGVLVSIQAETRLDQVCLFLDRFYRTDVLHRLTTLSLDSQSSQPNPSLRITIVAEGISLRGVPPRQYLFPRTKLSAPLDHQNTSLQVEDASVLPTSDFLAKVDGEWMHVAKVTGNQLIVERAVDGSHPAAHEAGDTIELIPLISGYDAQALTRYRDLIVRNPFAKPPPKVVIQEPSTAETTEPEIDAAEFTYFVGTFSEGDLSEVWFFDRLNNERVVVDAGSPFSIAGVKGVVQSIGKDFVVLEHDDSRWRIELGKTLRSMKRVPQTPDAAEAESSSSDSP